MDQISESGIDNATALTKLISGERGNLLQFVRRIYFRAAL
jgi:hypothetical protein